LQPEILGSRPIDEKYLQPVRADGVLASVVACRTAPDLGRNRAWEGIHVSKRAVVTLGLILLLAVAVAGCGSTGKSHPCNPVPDGIAVCLNGALLPLTANVVEHHGEYYAPADDLGAALGAKVVTSPDRKQVTVNGKNLSTTNGATNTLERDGRLYILILDGANAAGHGVAIDWVRHTVNIDK
jgi:hypothetical protein